MGKKHSTALSNNKILIWLIVFITFTMEINHVGLHSQIGIRLLAKTYYELHNITNRLLVIV